MIIGSEILEYWDYAKARLYRPGGSPKSVTLEHRTGMTCEITPEGNMRLNTQPDQTGAGVELGDLGRTADEWVNLIKEAAEVRDLAWPKEPELVLSGLTYHQPISVMSLPSRWEVSYYALDSGHISRRSFRHRQDALDFICAAFGEDAYKTVK